ncbi:MAG: DHH family phosphoesterase [Candidatus Hadarchaeales archaeon]
MNYFEQVERLYRENSDFKHAIETIKGLGKKSKVLNFSHNDVDGVCSAFLLKRMLKKYGGIETISVMPPDFKLTKKDVESFGKEGRFDLLIVSDKGTFEDYDEICEIASDVLIIDHHQPQGMPKICKVFNPRSDNKEYAAATTLLCHMIMTKLGISGEIEDFICAMGCRGDFAFDVVSGKCQPFARPFLEYVRPKIPEIFEIVKEKPTMFDTEDRTKTAILHKITEIVHAGTLAHLYSEDFVLDIPYGPDLVLNFFIELSETGKYPKNVEEFLSTKSGKLIGEVYEKFQNDWKILEKRVKNPIHLGKVGNASIYLIFAREIRRAEQTAFSAILPFVAFAHMNEFKKEGEETVIIVFCPKKIGTHISMRTDGKIINCGEFLARLAEKLRKRYPNEKISGGGHANAAGFFASSGVSMYKVLQELVSLTEEILTEINI